MLQRCPANRESRQRDTTNSEKITLNLFSINTRLFQVVEMSKPQTRVLHWDQAFWVGLVGFFRVLLGKNHFKRLIPIEHHLEVRCLFIYDTNVYCPKSKFTVRVSTCISVLKCFSRQKRSLSFSDWCASDREYSNGR